MGILERQATDAQRRAADTVSALSSTPASIGLLGSAVATGTNMATEVQTFKTTWGVLIQRIELMDKLASGFAQVFGT